MFCKVQRTHLWIVSKVLITCVFETLRLGLAEGEIGKRHFESIIDHLHATTDLVADLATLTSTPCPGS